MATDFELAHNPSVFEYNGSISSSGIYACYSNCRLQNQHHIYKTFGSRRYSSPNRSSSANGHQERKPRRPCLVNRSEDSTGSGSSSSGDENEPNSSPSKQKKKVVFADDRGLSLTQVRMMVQLPHSQPFTLNLSSQTDNKLKSGNDNAYNSNKKNYRQNDQSVVANRNFSNWKSTFNQPASNYVDFRRKLDEDNVSLENVIVKQNFNPDKELIGTIKVKNICYEKSVFIRTTTDDWLTHQDVECSFVGGSMHSSPASSSSVIVIYDTFSFKMVLPSSHSSIQFCVCFRAAQGEFWDNNQGNNYKLVKSDPEVITKSTNMKDISKSPSTTSNLKSHTWPKFAG